VFAWFDHGLDDPAEPVSTQELLSLLTNWPEATLRLDPVAGERLSTHPGSLCSRVSCAETSATGRAGSLVDRAPRRSVTEGICTPLEPRSCKLIGATSRRSARLVADPTLPPPVCRESHSRHEAATRAVRIN
jgi:hypothetical protein